jgi:hypothetical protein
MQDQNIDQSDNRTYPDFKCKLIAEWSVENMNPDMVSKWMQVLVLVSESK